MRWRGHNPPFCSLHMSHISIFTAPQCLLVRLPAAGWCQQQNNLNASTDKKAKAKFGHSCWTVSYCISSKLNKTKKKKISLRVVSRRSGSVLLQPATRRRSRKSSAENPTEIKINQLNNICSNTIVEVHPGHTITSSQPKGRTTQFPKRTTCKSRKAI